jgi:hypothetical protein
MSSRIRPQHLSATLTQPSKIKGIKGRGRKYKLHYKYVKRYVSLTQLAKKSQKTLKNRNTEDTASKKIVESIPIT